jgi:hypothetical protein
MKAKKSQSKEKALKPLSAKKRPEATDSHADIAWLEMRVHEAKTGELTPSRTRERRPWNARFKYRGPFMGHSTLGARRHAAR